MSHKADRQKVQETIESFLRGEGITLADIDKKLEKGEFNSETVKLILGELNRAAERKQIQLTAKERNKVLRQKQELETRYNDGSETHTIDVMSIGGYNAFGPQRDFHFSPVRFRIVIAGVRGGKTFSGAYETLRFALEESGRVVWVCAPTYKMVGVAQTEIENLLNGIEEVVIERNKKDRVIKLISGSVIQFHSLENYDALRGFKVDACWIDEASYAPYEALKVIRTRLSSTMGLLWLTTTPKGKNWVYDWYMMGLSDKPEHKDYESFHWETRENPFFPLEEWELAKADLPGDFFDQEYRAIFLDDMAGVFRGVKNVIQRPGVVVGDVKPPFSIGLDVAKAQDWTVITVMDSAGVVVDWQRFNRLPWPEQKSIIKSVWHQWNKIGEEQGGAWIVMDSTGVGAPLYDELVNEIGDEERVVPYMFTNASKRNLIQALQSAIEHEDILIPNEEVLIEELDFFQYQITKSGNMTYSAPIGKHDDSVISLSLSNWGRIHHLTPGGILIVDVLPDDATVRDVYDRSVDRTGMGTRSGSMWGNSKALEFDRE